LTFNYESTFSLAKQFRARAGRRKVNASVPAATQAKALAGQRTPNKNSSGFDFGQRTLEVGLEHLC